MAERSTITQITQVGVEATPGTLVPANRRLQALGISPSVQANVDMFRPAGSKFHTVQSLNQEWVEADIEGKPTYSEIVYPLASVLTSDTPTDNGDGSFVWSFTPATDNEDDPITFTVEKGSGFRAHRFTYGIVTELGLDISRDGFDLSGSMIGQILEDNVTLTGGATSVDLLPIVPSQISVFLDDTAAGLGTTKLTRVTSCNVSIGSRYNPAWFVDASEPSWSTHVEAEPDVTAELTLEADAVGMSLLNRLRDGQTRYLRIEANGPEIVAGVTNRLRIDLAVKVEDVGDFDDLDGIYGISFPLRVVHDQTWGRALTVEVRNDLGAL